MSERRISELERELADVSGKLEQARNSLNSFCKDHAPKDGIPLVVCPCCDLDAMRLRMEESEHLQQQVARAITLIDTKGGKYPDGTGTDAVNWLLCLDNLVHNFNSRGDRAQEYLDRAQAAEAEAEKLRDANSLLQGTIRQLNADANEFRQDAISLMAEAEKAKGERDYFDKLQADYSGKYASETALRLDWQGCAENFERQLGLMREALRQIYVLSRRRYVTDGGTDKQLAKMEALARAALTPEPAQSTPQIPCPTCGAMMSRNKLPNCGGSHGSAGHSPECYQRETFEQRMQEELSDAGQIVNRKQ